MAVFRRPDPHATCDPEHLAHLLGVESVDIDKERVIVKGAAPPDAQAIIDSYVYDPGFGKPSEETKLKTEIAQRLKSLDEATKTQVAWDGLTAAQRQETNRLALQLVVYLTRFLAQRMLDPGSNGT